MKRHRRSSPRRPWAAVLLVALIMTVACSPDASDTPPESAEQAALQVFRLAQETEPSQQGLSVLFAAEASRDSMDADRGALRDTLNSFRDASDVRVVTVEPLAGTPVTAVDLAADLPGGASARYSVHVKAESDGAYRVVWLMGPGADWPPQDRGHGTGLTTSSPPSDSRPSR